MENKDTESLRLDDQLFFDALKASPIGIALENLEGQPLFVNPALCSMLGYSEEELRGKHCVDFSPPEDAEKDWRLFQQLRAGSTDHYSLEKRYFRKDGSLMWGRLSVSLLKNKDSPRVVALVEDVTEKRTVQETLELATEQTAAVIRCSRDLRYLWANQGCANLLQRPLGEIVGRSIVEVLGTEAFEALRPYIERVLAGEKVTYEEELNYHGVGRRWVSATYTPTHGADGVTNGWVVVASDVTNRKLAEETIRQRGKELGEAQRVAQLGSWHWDPSTDTVTWSKELYRIAGCDPRQSAPSYKEHEQLYTTESWQRLQHAVEKALRTGEPYELDLEMVRPDGTMRWITARGEAELDATVGVLCLRGTAQDITERKSADAVLAESEGRFRLVANTAPVMIWMSGVDKLLNYVNQPCVEFTGLTSEALLDHGWTEGIHPDDVDRIWNTYIQAFDRHEPFQVEYRFRRHDGEYRWVIDSGVPRFNADGSFAGYIGTAVDVTERKLAEEALSTVSQRLIQAQEEERTRIARELHDDINQRLALLAANLESLQQNLPGSAAEIGKWLGAASKQVEDLAGDVQALSHRLHSSKLEHLGLARAAAGFCKELSNQQGVEIDFYSENVSQDLPREVSLCLFRILQEALQNAAKHSGTRHFQVSLSGGTREIELMVRDSGIGFNPDEAIRGRGLGLTSMRERLKLVNGTLSIDSQLQRGTTIQVRAPLSASAKSTGAVA